MSIPGSNLLNAAFQVIRPTIIQYYKYNGRTTDALKNYASTFDEPVDLIASVQAVSRRKYGDLGLDFQHNYIKIKASANLLDMSRDYSGDEFVFGGRKYQLLGQTSWYLIDGWASAIAIDIGPQS